MGGRRTYSASRLKLCFLASCTNLVEVICTLTVASNGAKVRGTRKRADDAVLWYISVCILHFIELSAYQVPTRIER